MSVTRPASKFGVVSSARLGFQPADRCERQESGTVNLPRRALSPTLVKCLGRLVQRLDPGNN